MQTASNRPRLPEGIYWLGAGHIRVLAIVGKSGAGGRRKETALHQGERESHEELIQRARIWQDETCAALRKLVPGTIRGSLRAAAATFLAGVPNDAKRARLASELAPWLAAQVDPTKPRAGLWGDRPREEFTRKDVIKLRDRWREAGVAASTINKYVHALRTLGRTLDGDDAPNPAAFVKKLREPKATARTINPAVLDQVLASMPDLGRGVKGTRSTVNKTKLRYQVQAATGLPPKQIMLLEPHDLDLAGRRTGVHPPGPHVYSHEREKGDGTPGDWLPLTPKGVAALRAFHAGHCYGWYSTSAAAKCFHRAVDRIVARLPDEEQAAFRQDAFPPDVRPYDQRHTFATAAAKANPHNPSVVGFLLQHAPGSTMWERYTVGAHADVMSAAIANLAAAQAPPPPKAKKRPRRRNHLRVVAGGRR